MTTPTQRIARLLDEGAKFMVQIPGHVAIDLTPDVVAMLDGVQTASDGFEPIKESIEPLIAGGDVSTHVQFL
jgi:hypothetical protein